MKPKLSPDVGIGAADEEKKESTSSAKEDELAAWLKSQKFSTNSDKEAALPSLQAQSALDLQPVDPLVAGCGCKATALIVDDSAFNLYPLKIMLRGLGITTEKASGGQEAIDQFIANR